MIIIISKMLIILEYVLAKSIKYSISSGVIHSSTEIITLENKKIKTIYKIKRASFARPRAVCPIIKRFTPSTPKTKLPTQKTIVGDFKLSCGIFETRSFIFVLSKELSLSSNVFSWAWFFGSLSYNIAITELAFIFSLFCKFYSPAKSSATFAASFSLSLSKCV